MARFMCSSVVVRVLCLSMPQLCSLLCGFNIMGAFFNVVGGTANSTVIFCGP